MRRQWSVALTATALLVFLFFPACGGEERATVGPAPDLPVGRGGARLQGQSPLQGEGWLGGDEVYPHHHGDGRLVVFFFDPAQSTSARLASLLVNLSGEHEDLLVVGATPATDKEAIQTFLHETGGSWPVLYGYGAITKEAYDVGQVPSVRVLDARGEVIGRDLLSLRAMLLD